MSRGRWPGTGKITFESCYALSISKLRKLNGLYGIHAGTLVWTNSWSKVKANAGLVVLVDEEDPSKDCIRLIYTITHRDTGEKEDMSYKIDIDSTPCHFGGNRYWFVCPLRKGWSSCGRRVAKLYLPSGGKIFGCRHCYDLTYRSCQEHDKRVDFLVKHPERIEAMMRGDIRGLTLALTAAWKYLSKLDKKRR